jgi:hypothetical protein
MNILPRDKQIEIIAALTEGMSIRAVERLTGVHRDTVMRLGLRVGHGCAELHDRTIHSLRVGRLELDEIWQYVGCKQKNVSRKDIPVRGDQYTFVALASAARAIVSYRGALRGATRSRASPQTSKADRNRRRKAMSPQCPNLKTHVSELGQYRVWTPRKAAPTARPP